MFRLLLIAFFLPLGAGAQPILSWLPPMTIGTPNNSNLHPRIALDGKGDPLVIWGDAQADRGWFAAWNGTGFTSPVSLNPSSLPVFTASWAGPQLATHGDTVYVVFKKKPENVDTNHVFIRRSFDGGLSFDPPVRVDYIADSLSRFPAVTTNAAGHPVVSFMKFDPGFGNPRWNVTRSNDYGLTFQPDIPASGYSGGIVCDCCPGSFAASGDDIAVLYRDNLNNLRNSWAGISTDGGASFPGGIQVDQTNWVINSCPSSGPDGVLVGDTLISVFMSEASGNTRVYWSKSVLPGLSFVAGGNITGPVPGLLTQNYPRIAGDGTAVAIVWKQNSGGTDQVLARFAVNVENGFPAPYDTVALGSAGSLANADVAVSPVAVHVVWQGNGGNLWYRKGIYSTTGMDLPAVHRSLQVYPNPAREMLFVDLPGTAKWKITDLAGGTMLSGHNRQPGTTLRIPTAGLRAGTYLFTVETAGKNETIRFSVL